MMSMPSTHNQWPLWLALSFVPRLAIAQKLALVEHFSLDQLFELPASVLKSLSLSDQQINAIRIPNKRRIDWIIETSVKRNDLIISFSDARYPASLKEIPNPPLVLFTKGNHALLQQPQIAIVGSRSATMSALNSARGFARDIVQRHVVVTSGMAIGIDSAAHQGALQAQGHTIAVVATGLDITYPKRNTSLEQAILANQGLVVSEFPPGSKPLPGCFPRRNRIITGLCLGTLVVEAQLASGSMISAQAALEQNREVFAMPGSINNPQAKGCHSLLKQGAKLVETVQDIFDELDIGQRPADIASSEKKCIKTQQQDLCIDSLLSSVDYETTSVDTVVSRSKLPIEQVMTRLMALELKGLVAAVPGGFIKKNN
ncbi:DNA-processing protein DprA [Thalassotalea aquiviva]|uniref:DNA-processing protein DprA n=1 Tax=Thalassotalea aquiviva TaxID=3242415 RepID=UPI00352AE043